MYQASRPVSGDWKEHLSDRYKRVVKAIAGDDGEELSEIVMKLAFHHYAEKYLKRLSPPECHADIERVFGFNVGLVPGNRFNEAKKAADAIAMPLLRAVDQYAGKPAQHAAAWAEQQFLAFEMSFEDYIQSQIEASRKQPPRRY